MINNHIRVKCKIGRGGFSSERTFRVTLANGAEHTGLAPIEYCFDQDGNVLPPSPPQEKVIEGFVAAQLLDSGPGNLALVYTPDGDVLQMSRDQLHFTSGGTRHVSLQS